MEVRFHHEARGEFNAYPSLAEKEAMQVALRRLELFGAELGYPHTSHVAGSPGLRELRPRGGNSPWRAFYRQVGARMLVAAFGPEARVDRHGFDRAVGLAAERIADYERREG